MSPVDLLWWLKLSAPHCLLLEFKHGKLCSSSSFRCSPTSRLMQPFLHVVLALDWWVLLLVQCEAGSRQKEEGAESKAEGAKEGCSGPKAWRGPGGL